MNTGQKATLFKDNESSGNNANSLRREKKEKQRTITKIFKQITERSVIIGV